MAEDDRIAVQSYYEMVVSKQPADVQEHLRDHIIDEVRVGNTKDESGKYRYLKSFFSCMRASLYMSVVDARLLVSFRYSILCTCGLIW